MQTKIHLEHFTDCIREDKRPIGLFLGAGCAKSLPAEGDGGPRIPDTKGMTTEINNRIEGEDHQDCWEFVVDRVKDPDEEISEVNIEDILSQVRGLHQYAIDGTEGAPGKKELEQLENIISEEIVKLVDVNLPEGESGYMDLATWLGSIDREEPVEIFTTNYDLLIEEALEKRRIGYFDGFVGGYRPFFDRHSVTNDDLPIHWVRLWKLHGSMNWVSRQDDVSTRIWRTDDIDGERAVIHPSNMKYDQSRKMPYLTLIDRLKEFLKRDGSVLFTVGYSFGDEHINDVIVQALREAPASTVFAFMYRQLDEYPEAKRLANNRSNFCLFARDAGIIGTEEQQWSIRDELSENNSDVVGMEWSESDDGTWEEQFVLGNFEKFGKLFLSVTGEEMR